MTHNAKPVTVIGSINMDLVTRVQRFPLSGETAAGSDLATVAGGKGANQAVAAARAGASVQFVGAVGADDYGRALKRGLERDAINVRRVRRVRTKPTGVALITLNAAGENQIVVSPGANATVSARRVSEAAPLIRRSALLLLQLETPVSAVARAIAIARRAGVPTVLNPAPALPLPPDLLGGVDVLIVNETEAMTLLGRQRLEPKVDLRRLASRIAGETVILTRGRHGALIHYENQSRPLRIKAHRVRAVDTTGAGDTFVGALSAALVRTGDLQQAASFASAAAALCVTRFGAQPSIPSRRQIERFVKCSSGGPS